ncbi:hypothetical protein [Flavobacterium sp.]|uniref:hypothetical protein n=1 Tax=Flavobacterium sp. TaxID=239 RepID=UPI002605C379|nr:hypothetical protein [Flavobacterium sp.]
MDIGYLKIKIDIKAEHDELKKKFEYRRKELKKEEVKNIFEGFKDYFKSDGNFKFKENEHSVTAEYREHGITLDMDIYKSIDSPAFDMEGFIRTYENETFDFEVEAVCSKEIAVNPAGISGQEKLLHDTAYFKDFLDGVIHYKFKYRIKGRQQEYFSIQELMQAL